MSYESNIPSLCEAITEYASIRSLKQPLEEILVDQANKLCCSSFGDLKGLYQEAAAIAPTKDQLLALPLEHGWEIKRKSGPIFTEFEIATVSKGKNKGKQRIRQKAGTEKGEIDKRIAHRLYEAVSWLSTRLNKYAPGKLGGINKSGVQITTEGGVMSIAIINRATMAAEVGERTGYIQKALDNRKVDLLVYINKHLDQASEKFRKMKI